MNPFFNNMPGAQDGAGFHPTGYSNGLEWMDPVFGYLGCVVCLSLTHTTLIWPYRPTGSPSSFGSPASDYELHTPSDIYAQCTLDGMGTDMYNSSPGLLPIDYSQANPAWAVHGVPLPSASPTAYGGACVHAYSYDHPHSAGPMGRNVDPDFYTVYDFNRASREMIPLGSPYATSYPDFSPMGMTSFSNHGLNPVSNLVHPLQHTGHALPPSQTLLPNGYAQTGIPFPPPEPYPTHPPTEQFPTLRSPSWRAPTVAPPGTDGRLVAQPTVEPAWDLRTAANASGYENWDGHAGLSLPSQPAQPHPMGVRHTFGTGMDYTFGFVAPLAQSNPTFVADNIFYITQNPSPSLATYTSPRTQVLIRMGEELPPSETDKKQGTQRPVVDGDRLLTCGWGDCTAVYDGVTGFDNHYKAMHPAAYQYQGRRHCHTLKCKGQSYNSFPTHLRTAHSYKKDVTCTHCQRLLSRLDSLDCHTGEKRATPLSCRHGCNTHFSCKGQRISHAKDHHRTCTRGCNQRFRCVGLRVSHEIECVG